MMIVSSKRCGVRIIGSLIRRRRRYTTPKQQQQQLLLHHHRRWYASSENNNNNNNEDVDDVFHSLENAEQHPSQQQQPTDGDGKTEKKIDFMRAAKIFFPDTLTEGFEQIPGEERDRLEDKFGKMAEAGNIDWNEVYKESFTPEVVQEFNKAGITDIDDMKQQFRVMAEDLFEKADSLNLEQMKNLNPADAKKEMMERRPENEGANTENDGADEEFMSVLESMKKGDTKGPPGLPGFGKGDDVNLGLGVVHPDILRRELLQQSKDPFNLKASRKPGDDRDETSEHDKQVDEQLNDPSVARAFTAKETRSLWPLFTDPDKLDGEPTHVQRERTYRKHKRWEKAMSMQDILERRSLNLRALLARQLLKHLYGVRTAKRLKHYWKNARTHKGGNQIDLFVAQLEKRLVVGLVRMRLAPNVTIARRMIGKKMVFVNDRVAMSGEYPLRDGDRVSIDYYRSYQIPGVQEYLRKLSGTSFEPYRDERPSHADTLSGHADAHYHVSEIPHARHVQVDYNILAGVWLYAPGLDDIRLPKNTSYGRHHEAARRLFQIVFSRLKHGP